MSNAYGCTFGYDMIKKLRTYEFIDSLGETQKRRTISARPLKTIQRFVGIIYATTQQFLLIFVEKLITRKWGINGQ